jgi:hypothetical protein
MAIGINILLVFVRICIVGDENVSLHERTDMFVTFYVGDCIYQITMKHFRRSGCAIDRW